MVHSPDRRVFPENDSFESLLPVRPDSVAVPDGVRHSPLLIVRFDLGDEAVDHPALVRARSMGLDVHELRVPVAAEERSVELAHVAVAHPDAWILPLEVGDTLVIDAVERLLATAVRSPTSDVIYADHVELSSDGSRRLRCKPSWSPHMLWTTDYLAAPMMFRAGLLDDDMLEVAGPSLHALRILLAERARRVAHLPDVLCFRSGERQPERIEPDRIASAIRTTLGPQAERVQVDVSPVADRPGAVVVDLTPIDAPRVSVIVPFRDKPDLLRVVADGVLHRTEYPTDRLEVILVDNGSVQDETRELLGELSADDRVRVLRDDSSPFNYSRVNNTAARHATGDILLFLNNDIEVIEPGWLASMVGYALLDDVGTVGALLSFPDGSVQHAGVVLGIGGYASHPFSGMPFEVDTPWGSPTMQRDLLASTAACVAIRATCFDEVGGFDETFQLCGSDVALGLAQHQVDRWNVQLPHARLVHHESVSRGSEIPKSDFVRSREVYDPWVAGRDPFYHPALTFDGWDCSLAAAHQPDLPPIRWSRRMHEDAQ